jgi:hypothetical protein
VDAVTDGGLLSLARSPASAGPETAGPPRKQRTETAGIDQALNEVGLSRLVQRIIAVARTWIPPREPYKIPELQPV